MNYVIYKYPISVMDEQVLTFPKGAMLMSIINQHGGLVIYAFVDPNTIESDSFHIRIIATGQPIDVNPIHVGFNFLGTVKQLKGALVWHIFIKKEEILKI